MAPRGLQQMLGAQAYGTFLATYWPHRHFVSHGHEHWLTALSGIAALQQPESLFTHWPDIGRAWSPKEQHKPARDVPAADLCTEYRSGHTIYLMRVERHVPELTPWIRGVERDLGLCRDSVICEVICSQTGQGAEAHFDPNMTINVQLLGRKTWKVADNDSIVNPDLGCGMGDKIPEELRPLLKAGFPAEMPAGASSFETTAGSIVYLPHGCWHSTECSEPSMALLFSVRTQFWHSMLAGEVQRVLRDHEVSRAVALIPPPGKQPRGESRQELKDSIALLKTLVDGLDEDALLRRWSGPPMTTFSRTEREAEPSDDVELLEWVEAQGGMFHTADAVAQFSAAAPADTLRRIWALESRGLLKTE